MTERIRLRPLSPDDAPEMTRVLADPALYQYTGGKPPTVEGLTGQYTVQSRGHSTDRTETWINHLVVFETSGKALGYVQATIPVSGQGPWPLIVDTVSVRLCRFRKRSGACGFVGVRADVADRGVAPAS
ncbi:GNAT family N-acetyltransferase, partial [Micrococcus luteus]|uniref:GNAT family N-acetyltransferase n=1 Tax=Micrococcus luteus TaxID=1270 RepID=UPI003980AE7A